MPFVIRDASITELEDLPGVFRRAAVSNENDRALLREHPEWLELPDAGIRDGRTRVAAEDDDAIAGFAT